MLVEMKHLDYILRRVDQMKDNQITRGKARLTLNLSSYFAFCCFNSGMELEAGLTEATVPQIFIICFLHISMLFFFLYL
jgi:hypothetical protein